MIHLGLAVTPVAQIASCCRVTASSAAMFLNIKQRSLRSLDSPEAKQDGTAFQHDFFYLLKLSDLTEFKIVSLSEGISVNTI